MRAFALLALSLLAPAAGAQSLGPTPTALPFLDLTPSPAQVGMADATVAQPSYDANVAMANPALLGLAGRDLTAATAAGPGSADWRGFGDISLRGVAQAAGADLRRFGVPLTVGGAYTHAAMGYGVQSLTGSDATYTPSDRYDALSLGAATTGAVRFALGATGRYVTSTDRAHVVDGEVDVNRIYGITMDVGAAVSADVMALAGRPTLALPAVGTLRPSVDVSVGYTQAHVGGRVRYTGGGWLPLPRAARLGWSIATGLDGQLASAGALRLIGLEVAAQADSRLVSEDEGGYHYAAVTGDLSPMDALSGSGDELVTGRRALRVSLFETVAFSRGAFGGGGFDNTQSRAFELRLAGPLKMVAALSGNSALARAARHLDLRWTRATMFIDTPHETNVTGFSLVVRR